jgi:hypothetical protein
VLTSDHPHVIGERGEIEVGARGPGSTDAPVHESVELERRLVRLDTPCQSRSGQRNDQLDLCRLDRLHDPALGVVAAEVVRQHEHVVLDVGRV